MHGIITSVASLKGSHFNINLSNINSSFLFENFADRSSVPKLGLMIVQIKELTVHEQRRSNYSMKSTVMM